MGCDDTAVSPVGAGADAGVIDPAGVGTCDSTMQHQHCQLHDR
jgi:hypothetical protein